MSVNVWIKRLYTSFNRDIKAYLDSMMKRPLFLVALICVGYTIFIFYSQMYYLIIAIPLILLVIGFKCKTNGKIVFILVLISLLCTYSNYIIAASLSNHIDINQKDFLLQVYKVEKKLDGSTKAYVIDENHNRFLIRDTNLKTGQKLIVKGNLKQPSWAGNPGEFDYSNYLLKKGIRYELRIDEVSDSTDTSYFMSMVNGLNEFFYKVKRHAFSYISKGRNDDYNALFSAICLGDTSLLENSTNQQFRNAGCSHLLAVSGTHFSGFLILLPIILDKLNVKRKISVIIYVFFCLFVGSVTGWTESVTRACFMSSFSYIKRDYLSSMSLASICLIIADPFSVLSNGFGMSFMAGIFIKVFSKPIEEKLNGKLDGKVSSFIAVLLSAQLGMMPFMNAVSQKFSFENLLLQSIGSVIAQLCCVFFIPTVVLVIFFPNLLLLSDPLYYSVKALQFITYIGSDISNFAINMGSVSVLFILVIFIGIIICFLPKSCLKTTMKIPFFILVVLSFISVFTGLVNRPICTVDFIDVAQGDSALIRVDNKTILIDGGTYEEGDNALYSYLCELGITHIDYAIMSHWDSDHAAGLFALKKRGIVDTIYSPYKELDYQVEKFLKKYEEKKNYSQALESIVVLKSGDRININENNYIEVISPQTALNGENDSSLVLTLYSGNTTFLFTGDMGVEKEKELLSVGSLYDVDILKVGHHGSKTSTSEEFLQVVKPEYSIISCGLNNLYGHPAKEVVYRLKSYNSRVLNTSTDGLITVNVYKNTYKVATYRNDILWYSSN